MSDFTPAIAWSGKDALSDGDANKIISGDDFNTEFSGVQTAVNSKYDSTDLGVTLQQYDANTAKTDTAQSWTAVQTMTSKQVRFAKGADVASGTALPLLTDGNYFDVTGTTTITSMNTSGVVGTVVKLHFDDALTLTHHATDLILPGAANITTAAGDEAEFVEYASGDWRCTSYQVASAVPGGAGGGWEFVSTVSASSDATINITGLTTGYDYQIVVENAVGATDNRTLITRMAVSGPTYRTTGYIATASQFTNGGVTHAQGYTTGINITGVGCGNSAGEFTSSIITVIDPANSGTKTYISSNTGCNAGEGTGAGTWITGTSSGYYNTAEAHVEIQFLYNTGNITSGDFSLYKRANA